MKKVLIALLVVVIIIACIVLGGYLLLKEDINYLKEEFGEEHLMEAIQSIYKIQNGEDEFLTTNDGKYMTATLNFESKIDEHMLVEYRAKKLQDTENLMMYENVGGDVVYTVSYEQNKMYTIFTIDEKTGSGTDFELTFSKRNGSGAKKIIDADKNDDYDYNVYIYNGSIEIRVKTRTKTLQAALEDGNITMERILEKAQDDADADLITATVFKDGGSTLYQYGTHTILKCNTVSGNKDVYIGPFGMQYDDVINDIKK